MPNKRANANWRRPPDRRTRRQTGSGGGPWRSGGRPSPLPIERASKRTGGRHDCRRRASQREREKEGVLILIERVVRLCTELPATKIRCRTNARFLKFFRARASVRSHSARTPYWLCLNCGVLTRVRASISAQNLNCARFLRAAFAQNFCGQFWHAL